MSEKIEVLEASLSHTVTEFDTEKKAVEAGHANETANIQQELAKLQRLLQLKSKESDRVKLLARRILEQRTQMEQFFLEALDHVRQEITANQ